MRLSDYLHSVWLSCCTLPGGHYCHPVAPRLYLDTSSLLYDHKHWPQPEKCYLHVTFLFNSFLVWRYIRKYRSQSIVGVHPIVICSISASLHQSIAYRESLRIVRILKAINVQASSVSKSSKCVRFARHLIWNSPPWTPRRSSSTAHSLECLQAKVKCVCSSDVCRLLHSAWSESPDHCRYHTHSINWRQKLSDKPLRHSIPSSFPVLGCLPLSSRQNHAYRHFTRYISCFTDRWHILVNRQTELGPYLTAGLVWIREILGPHLRGYVYYWVIDQVGSWWWRERGEREELLRPLTLGISWRARTSPPASSLPSLYHPQPLTFFQGYGRNEVSFLFDDWHFVHTLSFTCLFSAAAVLNQVQIFV